MKTAALGITAAGAVGAMTMSGPARAAMYGAAAAGAGQLALGWLASYAAKQDAEARQNAQQEQQAAAQGASKPARQGMSGYDPRQAFDDAGAFEDAEVYGAAA